MAGIHLVTGHDYEQLGSFLAHFPDERQGQDFWLDRLRYWWDSNPAFSDSTPRGWMANDEDKIVGFIANIPTALKVADQELMAYNASSWRVLPEFRSNSLGLMFKLLQASSKSVLFDATASGEIVPIIRGLGFAPLSELSDTRSVAITGLDKIASLKLKLGPLPAGLLRTVVSPFNRIAPLGLRRLKPVSGLDVKSLNHADEGFDQLWERTKNQYHATNVRTAKVINWYCFGSSIRRKELFACYRGTQLLGYMVCIDHKTAQTRPLECVDLWVDSNDLEVARALLSEAAAYATRNRCGYLSVAHINSFTKQICDKLGMLSRSGRETNEFFKAPKTLAQSVVRPDSYFVRAQGDYGL
jgi:hypothetical protein